MIERESEKEVEQEGERIAMGGEMVEKERDRQMKEGRGGYEAEREKNREQRSCVSDGGDKELGGMQDRGSLAHPTEDKNRLPLPLICPLFYTLFFQIKDKVVTRH